MSFLIVLSVLCAIGETSRMFDPYIICNDNVAMPPPPPGRSPFLNQLSLCSAVYGVPGENMGCFCDHPYSSLKCEEALGDPYLWSATTILVNEESRQRTWVTLFDLCFGMCYCSSAAKGRAARNETGRLQKSHNPLPSKIISENGNAVDGSSSSTALSTVLNQYDISDTLIEHSSLQSPYQTACGASCTRNADCQGVANGCSCKTEKESFVMGTGTIAFVASCMISLGGKREEDSPCPCNATYVSHACCGVESGIVWESESLKLGELKKS